MTALKVMKQNINSPHLLLFLVCFATFGCNIGHPVKTDKNVSESDMLGTWTYRTDINITLSENKNGIQLFKSKSYPITWGLTQDNHIKLNSIRYEFGPEVKIENFKFIISDDYRDHFYIFGGPVDFDNYEIWEKQS
jgi:hypothetical protein